jgi:hypothetical protein
MGVISIEGTAGWTIEPGRARDAVISAENDSNKNSNSKVTVYMYP